MPEITTRAVGWFSSESRWFQTRHSIESFYSHHGCKDTTYYMLFCGSLRDLSRISMPDYLRVVFPEQMNPHYVSNIDRFGLMGGFPRCLIVDHMIRQNHNHVMCLDGDTETLAPLEDIWRILWSENAFVTPHRIEPVPRDGKKLCPEQFVQSGNYNSGFLGFSNTGSTRRFIEWWLYESLEHPANFAEQGWLRFIGDYLNRVKIVRDQGVNCAYWRYDTSDQFRKSGDNSWLFDGVPVRLFHYSGLDFNNLEQVSQWQNRCLACPDMLEFLQRYKSIVIPE